MTLESVDRAGSQPNRPRAEGAGAARSEAPSHAVQDRVKQARVQEIRSNDSVEVRDLNVVRETYRIHRERLERTLEGRRKLVDAVRELMSTGALDSADAARRAADGMLRRGAM
jgi:hypothetical protein